MKKSGKYLQPKESIILEHFPSTYWALQS